MAVLLPGTQFLNFAAPGRAAGQALQRARDKSSVTENKHCVVGVGMGGLPSFFWQAVLWSKQKF